MLLNRDVLSRWHYFLVRWALGIYLCAHFAQLVPWGPELFSSQGVLPTASLSPLARLPNLLAIWDSPAFVTALLVWAASLSLAFALGVHDRIAAVLLWYVWACLFGRNPLIANPAIPYVGWMLLALASVPRVALAAEGGHASHHGGLPKQIQAAAWILLALSYTYSGCTKLVSPSWLDGTAVARILETPLARPGVLREALLLLPAPFLSLATWAALGLEVAFAPLALIPRLWPYLWTAALALHLVLIILIDFADLSVGMLVFHLFTLDPDWIRPPRVQEQRRCGFRTKPFAQPTLLSGNVRLPPRSGVR